MHITINLRKKLSIITSNRPLRGGIQNSTISVNNNTLNGKKEKKTSGSPSFKSILVYLVTRDFTNNKINKTPKLIKKSCPRYLIYLGTSLWLYP